MGKIYFQTRAYNAEKTFKRCVDSVLNQTRYGEDIVYYICDNGSTDSTGEMLREYAAKYPNIVAFYNEKNEVFEENEMTFFRFITELNDDDFFCTLDADDAYELDFLEKIIPFIRENGLDFAVCGNDFVNAISGELTGKRVLPRALILDEPNKLTNYFPVYHQFMRTFWGKLYTGKVARHIPPTDDDFPPEWKNLVNGTDTLMVFYALRQSKRVGIFPETLHRYYMFPKSSSRRWSSRRIDSNQILYEDARNYLLSFGPISEQNREFVSRVYANAIYDSLAILSKADKISEDDLFFKNENISVEYKLKEIRKIIDYPATAEMLEYKNADSQKSRKALFDLTFTLAKSLDWENEDFRYFLSKLSPECAPFITSSDLKMFSLEPSLMTALCNDNKAELIKQLLLMITKGEYTKHFDIFDIVHRLSRDNPLVSEITDVKFIKQYHKIYYMVWSKMYVQALDEMTEMMVSDKIANETFFQLYLSLAAMFESVDEFILGKIKLAAFYCAQKRNNECVAVLADLADMGVEDNDEITQIKTMLRN